ncbi:uncharacterized protein LOC132282703 [Cornus florida]|uniref:uncharacterized protein LOC132282703 n=1 Tax=Cornus florida TaxID=4283 RepID=UPI0028A1473C|nr:uncharacterized protein LOC132282703 [Cornus florida]
MPGNEVEDKVHNFFAPDNLSQGQVVDGNWPVLGNNPWVGSQSHLVVPNSKLKNYNLQLSDNERGHSSHSLRVPHGLNFTQSSYRPDFAKSQSRSPQTNLNGYINEQQVFQTRQNEANFLGVDTESDQRNVTSGGLSVYDSQQVNGPEYHTKVSVGPETSESPVSFDFFSGQPQMSIQQLGMLQSLPQQQSGFSDVQLLQQQQMFRKMQELQRQQQLQQLEARQRNSMNQFSAIAKQGSSNHSAALINDTPLAETSNYPWPTELATGNTNWLQRASPAMQGSSSGQIFPPGQGQTMCLTGLVPQQVDQSLYGVPISSSRGNQNQHFHIPLDKLPMQQMSTCSNSFPGNQYSVLPDQVSMQGESLVSGQGFQGKNTVGHASDQGLNNGMNLENRLQMNALQRNESMQECHGRQELAGSLEKSQEKPLMEVGPSKNAVGLDPTEEKILFGADENIWDAFGGSINASAEGCNPLNGTGFLNGFPSVQSGSWSALMQSAVAETSSSDIELQEEWSGLSFQNTEFPTRNRQSLAYKDSEKQQSVLADNNLQTALSSRSVTLSSDPNMNNNFCAPGSQQLEHKFSYEHGERLSHRSIQQSSDQGSKWLNRGPLQKPPAEESQVYGNAARSLDTEMNAKSNALRGSWTLQNGTSSYHSGGQPRKKPNGCNVIESVSQSEHATSKNNENDNSLQFSQSNHQKGLMYVEIGHVDGICNIDSLPNSTVELEHAKSAMRNPEVNREDSSLNNVGLIKNSRTARARQETSELLPNSHNLNSWRHVDSSMKCGGSEASGKPQNKGLQILESPVNSSDREAVRIDEMENHDKKENPSDGYRSHRNSTGGLRENVWSDANDSRILHAGKQKSSGHAGRRTSAPRKFQYHPMGNLDEDVEPSYGTKQSTHSQAVSQQISRGSKSQSQGYFGQSNFFRPIPKKSTEMEKGHLPDFQENTTEFDEVPSRGILPGSLHNMSTPFDRSVSKYAPNRDAPSSQNMLELLHKVDQSRECGTPMHFSSSVHNPSSEIPKVDNSDGSVGHLQKNHSSASHGFGLQLAPPSQQLPVPDHTLSSQSLAQTITSASSSNTTTEIKDKARTTLAPAAQTQSLSPFYGTSQGEFKNSKLDISGQTGNESSQYNMQRTSSSALNSGLPHSRSQHVTSTSGQVTTNRSMNTPFDRLASHSKEADDSSIQTLTGQSAPVSLPSTVGHIPHGVLAPQISAGEAVRVSQPSITSGISQQGASLKRIPNLWTSVPVQQRLLGAQPRKAPLNFFHSNQSNINVDSTSCAPQNLEVEDSRKGGSGPSAFVASSASSQDFVSGEEQSERESTSQRASSGNIFRAEKTCASQENETTVKHLTDASPLNPASTQRDLETFGHSLKPNNFLRQNYSLLHQMRAMKSSENDPSNRELKRFKATHSGQGVQQEAPSTGLSNDYITRDGDALVHRNAVPSGDSKMLSFLGSVNNCERNSSSQFGSVPSQDILGFSRDDPQICPASNNTPSVRPEHSQISPQMAPSWFDQFGTFKKGQMLPIYDAQKTAAGKSLGQPFTLGKPSDSVHAHNSTVQVNADADADASQVGNTSIPIAAANEHFFSLHSLPPDVIDQRLVIVRPKKRKSATCELLSWRKEVTQDSQSLWSISMAEVDWAKTSNRLIDKIEDEAEMIEDGPPMLRPKRRLILTTQLMQQLFRPPPAAVLSADAGSNYESILYSVARLALGSACSLISCWGTISHGLHDNINLSSDKHKSSERIGHWHISKVMEDYIGRAQKLENDFLRLDKRASVLDLRMECQDLEKFSVINRFAKFHGRGQADGAESSSYPDAAANAQKPFPKRYVTALPMPRNVPDRVQCLSL